MNKTPHHRPKAKLRLPNKHASQANNEPDEAVLIVLAKSRDLTAREFEVWRASTLATPGGLACGA
jgi:hypothetical protein